MKVVVHILSWVRIPLAFVVFFYAIEHQFVIAYVAVVVGALTDAADGWVAQRFGVGSDFGKNVVEPVCDSFLAIGAILGLCFIGVWPWWILVLIAPWFAALQTISFIAEKHKGRVIKTLKRHQYYLHPLSFLLVFFAAIVTYAYLAVSPAGFTADILMEVTLLIAVAFIAWWKSDRIGDWLAGPPKEK